VEEDWNFLSISRAVKREKLRRVKEGEKLFIKFGLLRSSLKTLMMNRA
jgi:hypothetical protein